ncbi:MAG: DUF4830 domain-containing protein [Ruminococcus sp.]|nr:DUF4830 domain-containing protein [Ruminococcus sp.]
MKKKIFFLVVLAIIIYAVIFFTAEKSGKDTDKPAKKAEIPASTTAERINYFSMHGWEVEEVSGKNIVIPSEFSGDYAEYAEIQDRQGLPLRDYAGKNGVLYVYEVRNYSPENMKMYAELITCEDKIIASLVYSEDGGSVSLPVI